MRSQRKVLLFGVLCAALAGGQAAFLLTSSQFYHETYHIIIGWGVGMSTGLSLLCFHIASFHCNAFIPMPTLLVKYLLYWFSAFMRFKHWRVYQRSSKDCTNAQSSFLLKRLRANENTDYGRAFKLNEIANVEEYIRKHPLTTYEHYEPYIKRVANGEMGVMLPEKPDILGKTSGTTGIAKLFPVSRESAEEFMGSANALTEQLRRKQGVTSPGPLQMQCSLMTGSPISFSEGKIPTGSVSRFLISDQIKEFLFTTPVPGFDIMHEPTSMYVHALFALRDENLGSIWTPFASSLYLFFRFLEISWHMLVQDFRQGTISDSLHSLPISVRTELMKYWKPLPDRANELERQFRMGFDGIAKRLWPHMPAIYTITSGSMQTFTRRVKKYTGDIQLLSGYYVSTEGILGLACEFPQDGQTKYVCIPNGPFYEFIPADYCDEENPGTLLLEEVRLGECYELVMTNKDGLYRYRMGDVVKITGFLNKSPIFQFQYRNGELLSLRAEKTSEISLTKALQETCEKWEEVKLVDYVCAESPLYEEALGQEPDACSMYYVIFVEMSADKDAELLTHAEERKKFEEEFDANLRAEAIPYDKYREKLSLGPLRVVFLESVAFSKFRVHLLETSTTCAGQLKLPRKLRKLEWVKLFLEHERKFTTAAEV